MSSVTRPTPTVQPQPIPKSETEAETEEQKQESNHTIKQQSPKNPEQPNNHNSPNQAATIQAKLTIGEPGDKYEQEADTVARKVMSENVLQLSYWPEPKKPKNIIARPKLSLIQQKAQEEGNNPTPNLENQLNNQKGGRSPLDEQTRSFMEPRFGADFSSVRVHTDSTAAQMNQQLGAQAFTHGNDIFFREGKAPGKNELTAHELTHVVQQTEAKPINEGKTKSQPKTPSFNKHISPSINKEVMQALPVNKFEQKDTNILAKNKQVTPTGQKISNYTGELPQPKQLTSKITPTSENVVQKNVEQIPIVGSGIKWIKEQLDKLGKLGKLIFKHLSSSWDVLQKIASNPTVFVNNLVNALRQGLQNFVKNIAIHLQSGFIGWLTGGLGVQQRIDLNNPQSIFNLAMGMLGLNWGYIRQKAAKKFGEGKVKALEKGFDLFIVLKQKGLAGLWEQLKAKMADIKQAVIEAIKNMLIDRIIKLAVQTLLKLLVPGGQLLQLAEACYSILSFLIEKAQKIVEVATNAISAVKKVASGDVSDAANKLEQSLAKSIPLLIGFLAGLLKINSLITKVKESLSKFKKKIDDWINTLLDKAKGWLSKQVNKFRNNRNNRNPNQSNKNRVLNDFTVKYAFTMSKERHHLIAKYKKGTLTLLMASGDPDLLIPTLKEAIKELETRKKINGSLKPSEQDSLERLEYALKEAENVENKIENNLNEVTAKYRTGNDWQKIQAAKEQETKVYLANIANKLHTVGKLLGVPDLENIKALKEYYKAPPKERYLPIPSGETPSEFIRKHLYGGWNSVSQKFMTANKPNLINEIKQVQKISDTTKRKSVWIKFQAEGFVEKNTLD